MALLAVVVLIALGLAMIAFAIVALRDDPPRWMLKVKRPGWVLFLGFVTVVIGLLVNAGRFDVSEVVGEFVGQQVNCRKIGTLDVEGSGRDVYACVAKGGGAPLGCFARVGEEVVDVTRRVETPGVLPGRPPNC